MISIVVDLASLVSDREQRIAGVTGGLGAAVISAHGHEIAADRGARGSVAVDRNTAYLPRRGAAIRSAVLDYVGRVSLRCAKSIGRRASESHSDAD